MIEFQSVSKRYKDIQAVNNLSLEIEQGTIFGLLGPNGAGKSTSISIMAGLVMPDSGDVLIGGLAAHDRKVKSKIGLVPQSIALYEELTALDNLKFFADLYSLDATTKDQRINWVLEFVDLQDRAKDLVKTFSGGMKRRLNLAASLLQDPDYIYMDEPTAGVDPQSRNKIFDNVLKLKKLGKTIIYTTHYMEEVEKLCDKVAIVDHGKLIALGTVDELIKEHGGSSLITIEAEGETKTIESLNLTQDLSHILENYNNISDLSVERPSLETVFLNLTGRQLRD